MSSLITGAKAWAVISIVLLLVGLAAGYFIRVQQPRAPALPTPLRRSR